MAGPFAKRFLNQPGVSTVELAIALPLFVGLIFGLVDTARIVAGLSTVRYAASQGTRLAVARGRPEWTHITAAYTTTGGILSETYDISGETPGLLMTTPDFMSANESPGSKRIKGYTDLITKLRIHTLFRVEARAIAYANQIMKTSVGNATYPCSPEFPNEMCFTCFTIRNSEELYNRIFSVEVPDNPRRAWTARMVGISCSYNVPITSSVVTLGWLPRVWTVRAQAYVPINDASGARFRQEEN